MKIPAALLAPVVLVTFAAVILAANAWELPTQKNEFAVTADGARQVQFLVDGLFCRGKSNFFVNMLAESHGLISVNTYVQEQRAVIVFDPSKISEPEIRQIIETQFQLDDGRIVQPFKVRALNE